MQSTPQYFEKRIDELERKLMQLQIQVDRLSRNTLLSDRQREAIERRVDL